MELKNFEIEMQKKVQKLGNSFTQKQIEKFYQYMQLLLEWNEKMNLTAITEPNEVILKHFIDSITIEKYIQKGEKVVDIGTGAGFPGIPLAIMKEENHFTLVDSLNKRILFLEEVIKQDELKNVELHHNRAEDFAKENREKFDVATSRAVAALPVLLEYLLPLVKVGGKCICMKGSNIQEEIEQAKTAIHVLGGEIEQVEKMYLPDTEMERNIVIIKKIKNTPTKYPRKAGTPAKEPIL